MTVGIRSNSPSTMMDSVVEGARETASSLQRLERRASVSSISPGRDLREEHSKRAQTCIFPSMARGGRPALTLSCCGDRGCGRQTGRELRRNCWCAGERWVPCDRRSCLGCRGPLGGHRGPVVRLDRSARAPGPGPVALGEERKKPRGREGRVQMNSLFIVSLCFPTGAAHR